MSSSQATLDSKPEYCEHTKPCDNIFQCNLTVFLFVWRCTKQERANCPDLEYCLKQKEAKHQC